jgi:hypothetical protein
LRKEFKKEFGISVKKKDTRRLFNEIEKITIFSRDKHKCFFRKYKFCPKIDVGIDDADCHHKILYCNGGKTNLKNGALAHKKCHKKYHRPQKPDIDLED